MAVVQMLKRNKIFKFDVFGRVVLIEKTQNGWASFFAGSDGKRRPADLVIPGSLKPQELAGYLDDLCHEWATERHPVVRRLDYGKSSLVVYEEAEILNDGLRLAMAWGKHWMQPIQSRLAKVYPDLSSGELDHYNAVCVAAMKFGHDTVYEMAKIAGKSTSKSEFETQFKGKYPWVNDKNLGHCFSQGMYYAWKDMGFK